MKVAIGGGCCVPPGGMISVPVTFASWCAHLALLPFCGFASVVVSPSSVRLPGVQPAVVPGHRLHQTKPIVRVGSRIRDVPSEISGEWGDGSRHFCSSDVQRHRDDFCLLIVMF